MAHGAVADDMWDTMFRRRLIPLVVGPMVLVLAGIAVAAPTDPQVVLDPVDQFWAESIVLAPTDLAKGWRETTTQDTESGGDEASTSCPEANLDQSDLTVTGGGNSDFSRGASSVSSFAIVWRTQEQAQTYFERTAAFMPLLQGCIARLLNASFSGIKITVTANRALQFPAVATRTTAYRIRVVIKANERTKKKQKPLVATYDTIVLGNGRASAFLYVDSFSSRPVSFAKEISLATALAARMETDPAGT